MYNYVYITIYNYIYIYIYAYIYIHNGNIQTFWHRKLYMKTWYNLNSLQILSSIFLICIFEPKLCQYLQYICY